MSTNTTLGRAAVIGAGSGVVASLVMAMYAMGAAYAKDTGFFTPLYHIASLVAAPDNMTESMAAGMGGDAFTFFAGTALLGAMIHMMTGAMYGAAFAVGVARLNLAAGALAGIGMVYGFAVFAASAFVGLPIAASIFGAGDPISNMADMAGWGTFIVEHLMFGVALGVLYALGRSRVPAVHRV